MRLEVFSPPYLFKGPRPTITAAPNQATYGQTVTIGTPSRPRSNLSRSSATASPPTHSTANSDWSTSRSRAERQTPSR